MAFSVAYANLLRRELSERSFKFRQKYRLAAQLSYGASPVVVYEPEDGRHGNFHPASYRKIVENDAWRRRLAKVHSSAGVALPKSDRKWCELDSCNSSDALLMNVFCFPEVWEDTRVLWMLGIDRAKAPEFGMRGRVPLEDGKFDRTEIDMRIGDLLLEAKLTEPGFQSKSKAALQSYRDFLEVFNRRDLPQAKDMYEGYQLIRNVLAAYAMDASFCVLCDARRPDLIEQWYAVMRCVKIAGLRVRCKVLTWQELAEVLPPELRDFLDEKYGIRPGPPMPYDFEHLRD
jgi:hypothetical protein